MKTLGMNLEHARVHNRRMIIEVVCLHGELTRAELARLTTLTPQTVSNIVAEPEQMDLLTSHQPRRASDRGQPAMPMSPNPVSVWSIDIHLNHQMLIVVPVNLAGEVYFRRLILVQKSQPGVTFARLAEVLNEIRALPTLDWSRVLGMGVVMPGPFDVEGISSTGPTTLSGWEGVDVATELGRFSGLPVTLENDVMVAAIGERFHGAAWQLNSSIYLYIGTGLGVGIFTDGYVYTSHAYNAGEIGYIVVTPNGRPYYCGNEGCLECYISLQAAYEFCGPDPYRAPLEDPLSVDTALFDQWITSILAPLRQVINLLRCVFDAETAVVDGMMPVPLLEKVLARLPPLCQFVYGRYLSVQRVKMGMTGTDTAALGAVALPIFDELNPQFQVLMKAVNTNALFGKAKQIKYFVT